MTKCPECGCSADAGDVLNACQHYALRMDAAAPGEGDAPPTSLGGGPAAVHAGKPTSPDPVAALPCAEGASEYDILTDADIEAAYLRGGPTHAELLRDRAGRILREARMHARWWDEWNSQSAAPPDTRIKQEPRCGGER